MRLFLVMNLTKRRAMFEGRRRMSRRQSRWLPLLLCVAATGCAGRKDGPYGETRALLASTDDFGTLLLNAGLRAESLPGADPLTPEETRRLWLLLSFDSTDGGMQRTGHRAAATYLLAEATLAGTPVSRSVLNERLLRFEKLATLRPDGCLVMVLSGTPVQCQGPVQVQDGALRAGEYIVGRFYASHEGGFREDTGLPPLPNSTFHHGVVVTVEPQ